MRISKQTSFVGCKLEIRLSSIVFHKFVIRFLLQSQDFVIKIYELMKLDIAAI